MYEMMIDGVRWEIEESWTEDNHRVHRLRRPPCSLCGTIVNGYKLVEVWPNDD